MLVNIPYMEHLGYGWCESDAVDVVLNCAEHLRQRAAVQACAANSETPKVVAVDNFCHIFFHRRFFETRKDHMKKTMLKLGVRSQHDFPVLTCLNQQWKFCQRTAGPELAPWLPTQLSTWWDGSCTFAVRCCRLLCWLQLFCWQLGSTPDMAETLQKL